MGKTIKLNCFRINFAAMKIMNSGWMVAMSHMNTINFENKILWRKKTQVKANKKSKGYKIVKYQSLNRVFFFSAGCQLQADTVQNMSKNRVATAKARTIHLYYVFKYVTPFPLLLCNNFRLNLRLCAIAKQNSPFGTIKE